MPWATVLVRASGAADGAYELNEEHLKEVFGLFGKVARVSVGKAGKIVTHAVEFESVRDAQQAVECMDQGEILGTNGPIQLQVRLKDHHRVNEGERKRDRSNVVETEYIPRQSWRTEEYSRDRYRGSRTRDGRLVDSYNDRRRRRSYSPDRYRGRSTSYDRYRAKRRRSNSRERVSRRSRSPSLRRGRSRRSLRSSSSRSRSFSSNSTTSTSSSSSPSSNTGPQ